MKTIKKGKPWSKEVTCTGTGNGGGGCKSLLEIEKTDLYITTSQCYGDSSPETHYTFKCHECGVETDVTNIPESVSRGLKKKS